MLVKTATDLVIVRCAAGALDIIVMPDRTSFFLLPNPDRVYRAIRWLLNAPAPLSGLGQLNNSFISAIDGYLRRRGFGE